jgi:hypothetical protein
VLPSSEHVQVALVTCSGFWGGCIPDNASALVRHHGHNNYDDAVRADIRTAAITWASMPKAGGSDGGAGNNASQCSAAPAGGAAALAAALRGGDHGADPHAATLRLASLWKARLLPPLQAGCAYVTTTSARLAKVGAVDMAAASVEAPPPPRRSSAAAGAGRVAMLLMASDERALVGAVDKYALYLATHWAYATKNGYEQLIYTHLAAAPDSVHKEGFHFFVKAPAAYGALFRLGYDTVVYVDWDTWIAPASALPIDLVTTSWPGASLLIQQNPEMFNAGEPPSCPRLHLLRCQAWRSVARRALGVALCANCAPTLASPTA